MPHSEKQGKGVAAPSRLALGGQRGPFLPRTLPEPVLGLQALLRSPSLCSKEVPQREVKAAQLRARYYSSRETPVPSVPVLAV